uniref:Uncharacterized protein n=1 Tax=Davidia involucrata TaxID=16924 RepID=A0A5B7BDP9_DAVIN
MSAEELKIRGELEMDIERDLEEEIKDGIYQFALRLHRLYHHQKERNARELSEPGIKKSKTLSEVNINIKMEGGTKIEIKEIKKEARQSVRPRTSRSETVVAQDTNKVDWVKTLRSGTSSPLGASKKNESSNQNRVLHNNQLRRNRNSTVCLGQRKRNVGAHENKLLELGWRS